MYKRGNLSRVCDPRVALIPPQFLRSPPNDGGGEIVRNHRIICIVIAIAFASQGVTYGDIVEVGDSLLRGIGKRFDTCTLWGSEV